MTTRSTGDVELCKLDDRGAKRENTFVGQRDPNEASLQSVSILDAAAMLQSRKVSTMFRVFSSVDALRLSHQGGRY